MFGNLTDLAKNVDTSALMKKANDIKAELKDENSSTSKQVDSLKEKLQENNQTGLATTIGQMQEKLREN
jgi:gas vesicle protein